MNDEYRLLATRFDYRPSDLARIARNAFTAALCETELRSSLLEEFDTWANFPIEDPCARSLA